VVEMPVDLETNHAKPHVWVIIALEHVRCVKMASVLKIHSKLVVKTISQPPQQIYLQKGEVIEPVKSLASIIIVPLHVKCVTLNLVEMKLREII
jgi:hypothetical protein